MRTVIKITHIFIHQPAKVEVNIKFKVIRISGKRYMSICARLWGMVKKGNYVKLARIMEERFK